MELQQLVLLKMIYIKSYLNVKKTALLIPMFPCVSGGVSLSGEKLQECINRATVRQKEIQKLIDKVINSVKAS